MSGRSQFLSWLSRQKFFQNGPIIPENGCKTVFSFKFLLACRLKMKNWIWAFAEARFEKHPLNHSLAHSLNLSSLFPDQMRYARKNQLSGVLYFILYIPWGCLEWDLMLLNFQGYILLRLVYHLRPLSSHIYCFKCLPALLDVLRQHSIRKWILIHERRHICKKILIERILPLKENCRFKCVFFCLAVEPFFSLGEPDYIP